MCGIDIVVAASAHDMMLPDIELVDGDLDGGSAEPMPHVPAGQAVLALTPLYVAE